MLNQTILVASDGSRSSTSAIRELALAGFPPGGEARIVTAPDPFFHVTKVGNALDEELVAMEPHARALRFAQEAEAMLAIALPGWSISSKTIDAPPHWAILDEADAWKPDMIVLGSHGHNPINRLLLGSVSYQVLGEATCSVRISKAHAHPHVVTNNDESLRVIVGVDDSIDSERTLKHIASRQWQNASIRLVSVLDLPLRMEFAEVALVPVEELIDKPESVEKLIGMRMLEKYRDSYFNNNQNVECEVRIGNPKHALVEMVGEWNADLIVVGAHGRNAIERILLGSVSTAVAHRAPCTVEVIR